MEMEQESNSENIVLENAEKLQNRIGIIDLKLYDERECQNYAKVGKSYLEAIVANIVLFYLEIQDNQKNKILENIRIQQSILNKYLQIKRLQIILGLLFHKNQQKQIQSLKYYLKKIIQYVSNIIQRQNPNLNQQKLQQDQSQLIFIYEKTLKSNEISSDTVSQLRQNSSSIKMNSQKINNDNQKSDLNFQDQENKIEKLQLSNILSELNRSYQKQQNLRQIQEFLKQYNSISLIRQLEQFKPAPFEYRVNKSIRKGQHHYQDVFLDFKIFQTKKLKKEYKSCGKGFKIKQAELNGCKQILKNLFSEHVYLFKEFINQKRKS